MAVDFSLCSICRRNPSIYTSLLELFAIGGSGSESPVISFHSNKLNMETLARAAQSNSSLQQLIQSGILKQFAQAIEGKRTRSFQFQFQFHSFNLIQIIDVKFLLFIDIPEFSEALGKEQPSNSLIESVTVALEFLTLLCEEWGCGETRDILATHLDVSLLKKLLKALCSYSGSGCQQLSVVEDAVIAFFRQLYWAHQENSRRFAQILLYVLQPSGSPSTY